MTHSGASPSFFLVGAAKSGTTSLARYLDQHPRLYLSNPKEPNFFAFPENERPTCLGPADPEQLYEKLLKYSVTSPEEYAALFESAPAGTITGEASVRYLYEPTSPVRIAETTPDAKILLLLRDPIARLNSHYQMNLRYGLEPLGIDRALEAEDQRVADGWGWDWHYHRVGLYGEQLKRYLERFGRDDVLVLFHRELNADPAAVFARTCRFLGVDPEDGVPDFSRRSHVGVAPRRRWLQRLLWDDSLLKTAARTLIPNGLRARVADRINKANRVQAGPPTERLREALTPRFLADKELLEDLIGKRVPW